MTKISVASPSMSEAQADGLLATDRMHVSALLAKADHRFMANEMRAAGAYYGAILQLAQQGVVLSQIELIRVRQTLNSIEAGYSEYLVEALEKAGFPKTQWHPRFLKSLRIMFGQEQRREPTEPYPQTPLTYFYPDMPYVEFAENGEFDWVRDVQEATETIKKEATVLLQTDGTFGPYMKANNQRPQGDSHGLLNNSNWSTFDLTDKGLPVAERVALCPKTFAKIQGCAPVCEIPNRGPTTMFSLLKAGARIPPHTGMINTRFVCHLPLIVPGNGALRVGSSTREWEEGKLLIFDDSVEHEAWNDAKIDRLVLIFDVWRPEVSDLERAQINAMFAAVDSY